MPTFTRVFILEDAKHILVRDETGLEVKFQSFAEFERCSGIDLTGKYEIGYEPEINYFFDSEDSSLGADNIPYTTYENLINSVAALQANKNDISYGRTDQQIIDELRPQRINESDIEFSNRVNSNRGGSIDSKQFRKNERTAARLIRKEAKGNINTQEAAWLDAYEATLDEEDRLEEKNDLLIEYIENQARTAQELLDLDVTNNTHWV